MSYEKLPNYLLKLPTQEYKKHSTFFEDVLKHLTSEFNIKCH